MTTKSVTQVNPYYGSTAAGMNAGKSSQTLSSAFTDCFSGVCGQQAQSSANVKDCKNTGQQPDRIKVQGSEKDAAVQTQDKTSTQTEAQKQQDIKNAENGKGQTENTDSAAKAEETEQTVPGAEEETLEKVEDAARQMIAEIAAQLGMTVEQVQQAMKELGMALGQVLENGGLKQLVMELSGAQSEADLLTDEGLYHAVKELTQTLEQVTDALQKELNLTEEQLEAALQQAAGKETKNPGVSAGIANQELLSGQEVQRETAAPLQEHKASDDGKTTSNDKEPVVIVEGEKPAESTLKPQQSAENGGRESGRREEYGDKNQGFLQQGGNPANVAGAAEEVFFNPAESARSVDTESIMRQIMDYMKIQVKADTTQLELQLHPANLGTVGVQIAAKDGVITAQFTAQNEAVKSALEAQVIQLKENLNEQGVKVEAVEVTIASHEFERNLQQNNSSGEGSPEENSRKRARRINLNPADGVETGEDSMDGLDEADKLAADMMVRNGNTVDFSA